MHTEDNLMIADNFGFWNWTTNELEIIPDEEF